MKQFRGVWLPDGDEHFREHLSKKNEEYKGFPAYQLEKLEAATSLVQNKRVAFDVGAHVGLWSRILADKFQQVVAFEPVREFCQCFMKNCHDFNNIELVWKALGDRQGKVNISLEEENSGRTHISDDGSAQVLMTTIDDYLTGSPVSSLDLLKIDVEGFEYQVLLGGEQSIKLFQPTVVIEQKKDNAERYGHNRYDACQLLETWGARRLRKINGDFCYGWD
jgi:FkbM family methyltransferase